MILQEGSSSLVVAELGFRVTYEALGVSGLVSPLLHMETILTAVLKVIPRTARGSSGVIASDFIGRGWGT